MSLKEYFASQHELFLKNTLGDLILLAKVSAKALIRKAWQKEANDHSGRSVSKLDKQHSWSIVSSWLDR